MPETTAPASPQSLIPPLPALEDFFFNAPLYAEYTLTGDSPYELFVGPLVVDGHCIACQRTSTFHRSAGDIPILDLQYRLNSVRFLTLTCARDEEHKILFCLRLRDPLIQKIGQYSSLADIANDESRTYRQVLSPEDGAELHRAVGLAAHGVGVGSFVYLRRVFERLISGRFKEFKQQEGWEPDQFERMRMDDKIELLHEHLPDFLVRNRKVYAILSKGVHELSEAECLSAFEMLKRSTFVILDEDKHKREELNLRRKAEEAITAFSRGKGVAAD